MNKKCLFGGALVAAGLANAANAQLSFSSTFSIQAGAYAYGGGTGPVFDTFTGPGFWSVIADDQGLGVATTSSNANQVLFNAYAASGGGSYVTNFAPGSYFTVGSDVVASAAWDFTNDSGSGEFTIDNVTDGVNLLSAGPGSSGSIPITLEAGKTYTMTFGIFQIDGTGNGGGSLIIPAPSSVALLALGGLFATRRRR